MADRGLTPKQQIFVTEYLVDFNATRAAIAAGYSERTAGKIGSENLQKPEIKAAIAEATKARQVDTGVTADRVVAEIASLAFAQTHGEAAWGQIKVKALDMLGRVTGIYREDNAQQKGELGDLAAALQAGRDRVRGRS
jgi:phage terminase small subunit